MKHIHLALLFGALFLSLFFGDGKQEIVEVVLSGALLCIMVFLRYYRTPLRLFPAELGSLWMLLLSYFILRTIFSDSVGYSFSETTRVSAAFLALYMTSVYSDISVFGYFLRGMVVLGALSAAAAIIYTTFQANLPTLPPMNLLVDVYGHNHVIDMLLFSVPAVAAFLTGRPAPVKLIVLVLIVSISVWSGSRAGLIVIAVSWIIYELTGIKGQRIDIRRLALPILAFMLAAGIAVVIDFKAAERPNEPGVSTPGFKSKLPDDARYGYWRQAWDGFLERPVFGSGPGTFYLVSKRLQQSQQSYSWFVHNHVLKTASETGIVGVALWFLVGVFVFRLIIRNRKGLPASPVRRAIITSVMAVLAYAQVEYLLEYYAVIVLFYVFLGTLILPENEARLTAKTPAAAWTSFGIALLFYVSSMTSLVLRNSGAPVRAAFFSAPYNADLALSSLNAFPDDGNSPSQIHLKLLEFFHNRNPEIAFGMAMAYDRIGQNDKAEVQINKAITNDPKNERYYKIYIEWLYKWDRDESVWSEARRYATHFLPPDRSRRALELPSPSQDVIGKEKTAITEWLFDSSVIHEIRFMKLVYALGYRHLTSDRATALQYWNAAQEIFPLSQPLHDELVLLAKELGDTGTLEWRCGGKGEYADFSQFCTVSSEGVPGDRKEAVLAFPEEL